MRLFLFVVFPNETRVKEKIFSRVLGVFIPLFQPKGKGVIQTIEGTYSSFYYLK